MRLQALLAACAVSASAVMAALPLARAADVPPAPPPMRAPAVVAAPPYSWYGFFIGIQGGYGFGGKAIAYTPNAASPFVPASLPGQVADNPAGFVGGITYGTNFQFGRMVIGTESDWSYSDIHKRETLGPVTGFATQVTAEQRLHYFSTSRARLGFLMSDQWLIYGTGGLASGRAESSSSFNLVAPAACAGVGLCPTGTREKTLWGWSAGGGLEFANGPWSLKVDYLYYDLGKLNYNVVDPTLPGGVIATSSRFSGSLVRGGLNYRFNWTPWDLVFGRR
jgi:outer membrane immunogenic protein